LKTRIICILFITIILLTVPGCGNRTAEKPQDTSSIGEIDHAKVTTIKTKFAQDEMLAGQQIIITVINQECTLEGEVPSEEARDKAVHLAGSVRGISTIIDKMEVKVKE
jgi:osmotically-inducible protein OsmY